MNQPFSFVHQQAKIADNVIIDPFVCIHKNVEVGDGTWIGSNVTIMEEPELGKIVRFFLVLLFLQFLRTLNMQAKKL